MVREQYKYPNVKLIDIDGTVLRKRKIYDPYDPRRPETEVLQGAVEKINKWFDQGYYICFFTSRPEEAYDITTKELNEAGFRYHRIIMEKPWTSGTIEWYDDKPIRAIQVHPDIGIRYVDEPSDIEEYNKDMEEVIEFLGEQKMPLKDLKKWIMEFKQQLKET